MRRSTTCLVISTLLLASNAVAALNNTTTRKFSVAPGGKLTVEADLGDLQLLTGGNDVEVDVIRSVEGNDRARGEQLLSSYAISFDQDGNDVSVHGRYDRLFNLSRWFNDHDSLRVRYVIHIPSRFNVSLTTSGGDIALGALNGVVDAQTSGGNITLATVGGPVTLRTSGGNIKLVRATGRIDLKTSGGSIQVDDASAAIDARTSGGSIAIGRSGGDVYARTSGGSIELGSISGTVDASTSGGSVNATFAAQPRGASRLATRGGSVTIAVPPAIHTDLDAHSSGGDVQTDIPVTILGSRKDNSVIGRINGGGPQLVLRTSGGGIHVKRGPARPAASVGKASAGFAQKG